jgi:hypothetical protein
MEEQETEKVKEEKKKSSKERREERRLELEAKAEAERLEKELQIREERRSNLLEVIQVCAANQVFKNTQRIRRVVSDRVALLSKSDHEETDKIKERYKTLLQEIRDEYDVAIKAMLSARDSKIKGIYREGEVELIAKANEWKPAYLEAETMLNEQVSQEEQVCKSFLETLSDVTLEQLESIAARMKSGDLKYDTERSPEPGPQSPTAQ